MPLDLGRIGRGILTGGLSEAYYAGTGQYGYGQPGRTGGPYGSMPAPGYADIPGYGAREGSLSTFAQTRGGGEFRQGQADLSNLLMRQATGQDSFAAAKLKQDMGRLQAQQMSTMASASPQNAALASRTASQNMGQIGADMAGQSQLAQIAERTAAAQVAGGVLGQGRAGDIDAYLGAQRISADQASQQAQQRLGEQQILADRYRTAMSVPSRGEQILGMIGGGAQLASMLSDVRLKENVRPVQISDEDLRAMERLDAEQRAFEQARLRSPGGKVSDEDVRTERKAIGADIANKGRAATQAAARGIRDAGPNRFDPRQPGESASRSVGRALIGGHTELGRAMGGGPSVGLRPPIDEFLAAAKPYESNYKAETGLPTDPRTTAMAQNIEKVAPEAVINTPQGKMVDYSRLGPAMVAGLGRLHERLAAMEPQSFMGRDAGGPRVVYQPKEQTQVAARQGRSITGR